MHNIISKPNIALFSRYGRMGASSRLRTFQYLPEMESAGFTIDVFPLVDDDYLIDIYENHQYSKYYIIKKYIARIKQLLACKKYDVIWIEKELFPYWPAWAEQLLTFLGKPYVVDYDDATFHNYDLSANKLVRHFLGDKIDRVMCWAHCVICGNTYLASRAEKSGAKRVEIIPTVVDHTRYQLSEPINRDKVVIGWIGSPSTQKYVVELKSVLQKVCTENNARLMLIGAHPGVVLEFENIAVEVIPWAEDTEASSISEFDIGIMPLPNGLWERGKCGYKLIQYMACGKPVVASPVGINVEIVESNSSGYLASNDNEWELALTQLVRDATLRKKLGDGGRLTVENNYSIQSQVLKIITLFDVQLR